jgi:DNA-binding transcriptional LysR family regulator
MITSSTIAAEPEAMPNTPSLDDLAVFAAVAETGGFTSAAMRLGTTTGGVSRRIRALEERLRGQLFVRTTRRVRLTEAGRALHERARPALEALREAVAAFDARRTELSGTLRLTAPVDHAAEVLAPALARFRELHPHVGVHVHTSDTVVDLVAEGLDLGIRLGHLRDSSFKATRLATFEQMAVASPAYLARAGAPKHPSDLADHEWIGFTRLRSPLTWTFTRSNGAQARVRMKTSVVVDSSTTLRSLLEQGLGVSVLDQHSVTDALARGRLVRVLPQWRLPTGGIYAVLPPSRFAPPLVRAFIEFYRGVVSAQGGGAAEAIVPAARRTK